MGGSSLFPQESHFLPKQIGLWGMSWRLVQKDLGSLIWALCSDAGVSHGGQHCRLVGPEDPYTSLGVLMGGHLENGELILWRATPTEASVHSTARLIGSKPNSGAPSHVQGPGWAPRG